MIVSDEINKLHNFHLLKVTAYMEYTVWESIYAQ